MQYLKKLKKLKKILIELFPDNRFGREKPTPQDQHLAQLRLERLQPDVERGQG